jgi:hypothetical protein
VYCKKCKENLDDFNFKEITINIGDKIIKQHKSICILCEEETFKRYKKTYRDCSHRVRIKLINLMGGKCICCGVSEWWNLTFDHIIPIKTQKRENVTTFIRKLIKNPELRKDFQIMCFGCNGSKNIYEKCQLTHDLNT